MAYSKTNWVNNTTPINETNLNKIEQGIYDNSLVVDAVTNTLNPTDTETYKTAELTTALTRTSSRQSNYNTNTEL